MKLATGILILGMGLGTAGAQNPSILDNTKAKLVAVQQQKAAETTIAMASAPQQSAGSPAAAAPPAGKMVSAAQAQAASQAQSSKQQSAPSSASRAAGSKKTSSKTRKAKTTTVSVKKPAQPKTAVAVEDKKNPVDPKKDAHKSISVAGGRRDPFLSPVVNRGMGGSGCSTGKRCLAVDQIALTGIVKSEAGMIAVVINAMNKAYFLRENDPVFNGYVVKITGDSIVFKETMQDKLGKSFTREVTKKISTPAV
jgi:hypothetical protein